jgi:hypothetical protein
MVQQRRIVDVRELRHVAIESQNQVFNITRKKMEELQQNISNLIDVFRIYPNTPPPELYLYGLLLEVNEQQTW